MHNMLVSTIIVHFVCSCIFVSICLPSTLKELTDSLTLCMYRLCLFPIFHSFLCVVVDKPWGLVLITCFVLASYHIKNVLRGINKSCKLDRLACRLARSLIDSLTDSLTFSLTESLSLSLSLSLAFFTICQELKLTSR